MVRIDTAERRRRVGIRHHLAASAKVDNVAQLARDLVGIHATDPTSVYLGALARMTALSREDMAKALYDDRSVLKILGMRRTMFVVPRDLAPIINSAATAAIGVRERKRLLQMLTDAKVATDVAAWLAEVEAATVAALDVLGGATAGELTKRVEGLRVKLAFGAGKKWAGSVGVSTRMLFLLSAEGRVIRGRPKGSWLSSMYEWAPMETWLGGPLQDLPTEEAQAELVRRWLHAFGPGTQRDIQWWTGWTVAETKGALASIGAVEVELEDGIGFVAPDDLDGTPSPEPWVALLPALDTTTMGWTDRSWYLGHHGPRLFDTSGNAGPTIWIDGRIVGGWSVRHTGEIAYELLEDVARSHVHEIERQADRLEQWIGNSRVIPRFRTPLELELT
jgi:hypothetical protein